MLTCNRCAYMVQAYCVNYDFHRLYFTLLSLLRTLDNLVYPKYCKVHILHTFKLTQLSSYFVVICRFVSSPFRKK